MTLDQIIERCRLPIRVKHTGTKFLLHWNGQGWWCHKPEMAGLIYLLAVSDYDPGGEAVSEQYQVGSMR